MRVVSELVDDAVASTTAGDHLVVNVWRGGQVLRQNLDVEAFGFRWSASQQVQGQGSLTLSDPDGTLAPISMTDALGSGGSRLQVTWVWGDSRIPPIPLGWWRIRKPKGDASWRYYAPRTLSTATGYGEGAFGVGPYGGAGESVPELVDGVGADSILVSDGGRVSVEVEEETRSIDFARMGPTPVVEATSLAEVRRLLVGICAVTVSGVADRDVPASLVYEESRLDAVEDHLDRVNAAHRMAADGSLEVVPAQGVGPVWSIAMGDRGALVSHDHEVSDDDFHNIVISTGESEAGVQLVGYAALAGDLGPDGPFGSKPLFHRSPAKTQSGVQADAETLLTNRQAAGVVPISLTCLAHPGIQMHDIVRVEVPTVSGTRWVEGRVTGMSLSSATGTPSKTMGLTLSVSTDVFEAIAWTVENA